jgi:hypothetical protein
MSRLTTAAFKLVELALVLLMLALPETKDQEELQEVLADISEVDGVLDVDTTDVEVG